MPARIVIICSLLIIVMAITGNLDAGEAPLRIVQTIPLPNVEGRIDHLAIDIKGQRLFVAALGNNTVEVVDLKAGKRTRTIGGLREPQGVGFISEFNKLFVANAKSGACDIFDGDSFKPVKSVKFSADADNVRYDSSTDRVYVGYGDGALGVVAAASGERIGDIKLDGHPESFQLEKNGPRIFVNIPTARKIAVVDRAKAAVIGSWTVEGRDNFPMALDEEHHRLFVVTRKPAKLVVFDTESGRIVASLDAPGDADDVFYDAAKRRIYVSGGEGAIGVFRQVDADRYEAVGKIATAAGARTSLFVSELGRLYLAAPHRGSQTAEIRVYETQP
ncbi:MAG TPA: YncE family protein [Candidatus Binatia bacterium]